MQARICHAPKEKKMERRPWLLLLLSCCLAVALMPTPSQAAESYVMTLELGSAYTNPVDISSNNTGYVTVIGRLYNTTDCPYSGQSIIYCPWVEANPGTEPGGSWRVTITAQGTPFEYDTVVPETPAPAPAPAPATVNTGHLPGHKTLLNPALLPAVPSLPAMAQMPSRKPGPVTEVVSLPNNCPAQGCSFNVQTNLYGTFAFPIWAIRVGATRFSATTTIRGVEVSAATPLKVVWIGGPLSNLTMDLSPSRPQRVELDGRVKLTATVLSVNTSTTPIWGAPVQFIVTKALVTPTNQTNQTRVAAYDTESITGPTDSDAGSKASLASLFPIVKQAVTNVNGQAILRLENPRPNTPGRYSVVARVGLGDKNVTIVLAESNPVLVTWGGKHCGDYGYGEQGRYG